jgi:hypothetical protein
MMVWQCGPTGELAKALAAAQGQIKGAAKDSQNPHFKNRYADLASVWDACRKALTDNGLSVAQFTQIHADAGTVLVTRLLHTSGESVEGSTPLLMGKQDMQALGSAITYARRYGLAAMVGVAPEDDDGNAAVEPDQIRVAAKAKPVPEGYEDWRSDLIAAADSGMDALRAAWTASKPEYRAHAGSSLLDSLKAKAAAVTVPA